MKTANEPKGDIGPANTHIHDMYAHINPTELAADSKRFCRERTRWFSRSIYLFILYFNEFHLGNLFSPVLFSFFSLSLFFVFLFVLRSLNWHFMLFLTRLFDYITMCTHMIFGRKRVVVLCGKHSPMPRNVYTHALYNVYTTWWACVFGFLLLHDFFGYLNFILFFSFSFHVYGFLYSAWFAIRIFPFSCRRTFFSPLVRHTHRAAHIRCVHLF